MNERTIFLAALDLDPAARPAYLDLACAGDAALRGRVEALVAAAERSGEFLDRPAVEQLAGARGPRTTRDSETSDDEATPEAERAAAVLATLEPSTEPGSLGRLGPYEIREVLGSGGFGTVLKAFDVKLERLVAVKVLAPELAVTSPPRKRFLREARAAAQVRHENVVAVHAVEERPLPYLVMEYVPGLTLQQTIDRHGPLDAAEVIEIGRQLAEGLAAAHALGLVHRDVKPSNVLVEAGPRPRVKITDFGLARAAADASLTQSGAIVGTPMYMSPEQAHGSGLDARSDLFSLGSVLYLLVTGVPPFRAPSTLSVLKRVADESPRPIREQTPEAPDRLVAVIERLHAKNPEDRFATAAEVAEALGRERADGVEATRRKTTNGATRRASASRWNSKRLAIAAAGVVVACVAIVFFTQQRSPPRSQPPLQPSPPSVPGGPAERRVEAPAAPLAIEVDDWEDDWDEAVRARVAELPASQQRTTILRGLAVLSGFVGQVDFEIADDAIVGVRMPALAAKDLRPLAPLRRLEKLSFVSRIGANDPRRDPTIDLRPLAGMRLREFAAPHCRVESLEPLRGMPLTKVDVRGFDPGSLEPLTGAPIREIKLDVRTERALTFLHLFPNLQRINDEEASAFWTPKPSPADATIAGDELVKRLRVEWPEKNGYQPELGPQVVDGVLVELYVTSNEVVDLSPLSRLTTLKRLTLRSTTRSETKAVSLAPLRELPLEKLWLQDVRVEDLSPLRGLELRDFLVVRAKIADLEPLRGMPLANVALLGTNVSDISALRGAPLERFQCSESPIVDLAPLKGAPLRTFTSERCPFTDLTPLADSPLTDVSLGYSSVSDLSALRGLKLKRAAFRSLRLKDLSPLDGMPLESLNLIGSTYPDVTPLRGMPLKELSLAWVEHSDAARPNSRETVSSPRAARVDLQPLTGLPIESLRAVIETPEDREVVRSLKQLKIVNGEPVEAFLKRAEEVAPAESNSQSPPSEP